MFTEVERPVAFVKLMRYFREKVSATGSDRTDLDVGLWLLNVTVLSQRD